MSNLTAVLIVSLLNSIAILMLAAALLLLGIVLRRRINRESKD